MMKVTGALQKSTEIMKLSNNLVKIPQISATMRDMSMEMTKVRRLLQNMAALTRMQAGIMEEMMDDALEGLDEDPELEEEAEEEVDRVLYEITDGKLGVAGAGKELPVRSRLFLALHCWMFTCIIESQRRRGGSCKRSGDGTDASSAQQPAEWIDGRRMLWCSTTTIAGCTRIFTSRSRLFMISFTIISCSRLAFFYLIETPILSPLLSSIARLEMLPTRSFVRVVRSARPAQVTFRLRCPVRRRERQRSTQVTAVSRIGICAASRVCCCCPNWRICRQEERKRTSPVSPTSRHAEHSNTSQGKYTVTLIPGDGRSPIILHICSMSPTIPRYRPRN